MVLGRRDDAARRPLIDKVGLAGRTFVADDWEGCRRVIPQGRLFTGEDLAFPIEQGDSNARHSLAHLRRRSKIVSKCRTMVDLPLRLLHHLQDPKTRTAYAEQLRINLGQNSQLL